MKAHKFAAIGSIIVAVCFFLVYYFATQSTIHFILGAVWLLLGINQVYQVYLYNKRNQQK